MQSAALYIRVSTDDQLEYSPAAQRKALLDYAARNDLSVSEGHIFADEGFSGKTAAKRPAFMRMVGMAKQRRFDVILVHKFDRFARSRMDSVIYKSMLRKDCGIKVISITEDFGGDDKMSILIESVLEAMAEYYSINLAEEVKKGMAERALRGGYQTSPPLGYDMDPHTKTLTINDSEAQHIKFIFDQFTLHQKSKLEIARRLTALNIKSKRGNPIGCRNVGYILQNPVYTGKTRWNHITAQSQHEPLISDGQFQKASLLISAALYIRKPRQRPLDACRHWLSGLIKCSNCGSSLVSTGMGGKYPSFQCKGYATGKCGVSHCIIAKKIEHAVTEELSRLSIDINDVTPAANANQSEIDLLAKRLLSLPHRILRAKTAYLDGTDTLDEYKKTKTDIELQQAKLTEQIESLKSPQPNPTERADVLRAKQTLIRSIIDKIIYDKDNYALNIYFISP
jgi:DNA invertase Pin-like site-specific DNA recombinase